MANTDQQRDGLPFIPAALDDAGLTLAQFRVYCHIVRRGDCFESVAKLAQVCCVHRDTIWPALRSLIEFGMVSRVSRPGATSVYRPNPIASWRGPTGNGGAPENKGYPSKSSRGTGKGGLPPTGKGGLQRFSPEGSPTKGAPPTGKGGLPLSDTEKILREQELKRLRQRLSDIGTCHLSDDERTEKRKLKDREHELLSMLEAVI